MSSIEYDLIVPTEFIKRYIEFVILNIFCASFTQMKLSCVRYIFRFIFKFALPRLFFDLWLSL